MKVNSLPAMFAMTVFFGVVLVCASIYRPSVAFQLVMLICGTISFTGMCIVKAIKEHKND